ncbi:MAG: hypothetical protein R3Y09_04385 [Clostridia bacterium]
MKEKYFKELARVFKEEGIEHQLESDEVFKVMLDNQVVCRCGQHGSLFFSDKYLKNAESEKLVETITPIVNEVYEYISLMEIAPLVKSSSGNGDYHLLADFKNSILGGKETTHGGYQFVTWEKDGTGKGFNFGHYFGDNYSAAKEDFALRAGLISKDRLFSENEMAVLHKCMKATIEDGTVLSYSDETIAEELCEQMENLHPQLKQPPQHDFEMSM